MTINEIKQAHNYKNILETVNVYKMGARRHHHHHHGHGHGHGHGSCNDDHKESLESKKKVYR